MSKLEEMVETTAPDLSEKTEKIERPAKAWRNWYRALVPLNFNTGERVQRGAVYHADRTWPSKDAAETWFHRADASYPSKNGRAKYLGAFPEGERPE